MQNVQPRDLAEYDLVKPGLLFLACAAGAESTLAAVLHPGQLDPNVLDARGSCGLHVAVEYARASLVPLLLSRGVGNLRVIRNTAGFSPLEAAFAQHKNTPAVKEMRLALLSAFAKTEPQASVGPKDISADAAAVRKSIRAVAVAGDFHDFGWSVITNYHWPTSQFCKAHHIIACLILVKHLADLDPSGDLATLALLDILTDVNELDSAIPGLSLFADPFDPARRAQALPWMIGALLLRGAKIVSTDALGRSPLHFAARSGRLDILEVLLEDCSASNRSQLVHMCVFVFQLPAPGFYDLQEHPPLPSLGRLDFRQRSALHYAAAVGNEDFVGIIGQLIKLGAPLAAMDDAGASAMALAAARGQQELVAVLGRATIVAFAAAPLWGPAPTDPAVLVGLDPVAASIVPVKTRFLAAAAENNLSVHHNLSKLPWGLDD